MEKTVYIGNVHPRITQAHLEKLMQKFGPFQRLDLRFKPSSSSPVPTSRDGGGRHHHQHHQRRTGPSHGFAFCEFDDPTSAQQAIQNLDGRQLCGNRLVVRPAHSKKEEGRGLQVVSSGSSSSSNINSTMTRSQNEEQRLEVRINALKAKLKANERTK